MEEKLKIYQQTFQFTGRKENKAKELEGQRKKVNKSFAVDNKQQVHYEGKLQVNFWVIPPTFFKAILAI